MADFSNFSDEQIVRMMEEIAKRMISDENMLASLRSEHRTRQMRKIANGEIAVEKIASNTISRNRNSRTTLFEKLGF